eukprot:6827020-Heterocapsa_arctica.AAC.1
MSDGSNQLVRWLEPPDATTHSLHQVSHDQLPQTLPETPLIGREVTGPPDGMVKQEFEVMLRKGERSTTH